MPMPVFDCQNVMHYLEIEELIRIYKEQSRRIIVQAESGSYYIPSTIAQISEIMSPLGFYQINSNLIVNVNKIMEYDGGHYAKVTIADGSVHDVSRDRKKGLEAKLNENHSRNKIR